MKLKKIWIIAFLLLVVQLIMGYSINQYFCPFKVSLIHIIILLTEGILKSIGIGAIISALISFIPIRRLKYIRKFKMIFPFGITLMAAFTIIINCYVTYFDYTGKLLFNMPKYEYDSIPVPHDLNCSTLHSGKFETDDYLITREGSIQIDSNKFTNEVEIYKIIWLSDCEYYLISDFGEDTTRVKIMSIKKKFYDDYHSVYSTYFHDYGPAWRGRVRIIKNGNQVKSNSENCLFHCILECAFLSRGIRSTRPGRNRNAETCKGQVRAGK